MLMSHVKACRESDTCILDPAWRGENKDSATGMWKFPTAAEPLPDAPRAATQRDVGGNACGTIIADLIASRAEALRAGVDLRQNVPAGVRLVNRLAPVYG
jgi:hypothetical protein